MGNKTLLIASFGLPSNTLKLQRSFEYQLIDLQQTYSIKKLISGSSINSMSVNIVINSSNVL